MGTGSVAYIRSMHVELVDGNSAYKHVYDMEQVEINAPRFCPAAQRAYWDDNEDVRVNTLQSFALAELCACCDDCTRSAQPKCNRLHRYLHTNSLHKSITCILLYGAGTCCTPGCETGDTDACGYGNSSRSGGFRHFSEYGLREGRIWHSEMCTAQGTDWVQQDCIGCEGQMHVTGVGDFEVSVNGFILTSGQDWTRTHSLTFNSSCWEPTVYAVRSVVPAP